MSAASFADWLNTIQNTPNTPAKTPGVQGKNAAVIGEITPNTPNTPNTPQKQQGQIENAKTRAAPANDPQGFDPGESALMMVAMRFCDAINASDKAREDWREDVRNTPPHLRQGLGEYLRQQLRQPHLLWRNQK